MPTLYNYIVTATVPLTGSDLRYGTQDIRIGGSGTINGSSTAGMNSSTVPPNGTTNTTAVTWSVTAGSSSLQSWSQSGSNVNFVVKSDASPGDVTFRITSNGNTSQFFSITVHIIRPISAVTGGLVSSTDAALYNYTDPSGNSAKIAYLPRNTVVNLKIAADPWNATNTALLTSQNLLTGLSGETLSTFMTVGTKTVDASGVTTIPITIKDVDISGTKLISMAIFPQETYYSYTPYSVFFYLTNDSVSATTPITFIDGRLPYTGTDNTNMASIGASSLVADASGAYKFVMKTGETNKQLFCGVTPSTAAQGVQWSSSNTAVATVSSDGYIVSVPGTGETVITATSLQDSSKKSTITIVVFGDTVHNLGMTPIVVRDASNIPMTVSLLPDGLYNIPNGTYAYMVQLDQIVTLSTSVIPNNAEDTTYNWYTDVYSDFNGSYIAQDGTFTAYNDGVSKLVRVVAQSNTNYNETEVLIYIYQYTPVSNMVSLSSTGYTDASGHTVVKPGDTNGISGGVTNTDASFKNVNWTLSDSSLASLAASTSQGGNGVTFGSTEGLVTLTATSQDNPSISQSMTFRIWNYTSATSVTDISCATIAPVLDASATDLAGQNIYVTHIPNSTFVQLAASVLPEDALIKGLNWGGSSGYFTALGLPGADQVNGGNGFISIGSDGRIYADAQAYGYYAVTAQAADGGAVSNPFYVYIDPYVEPISIEITAAGSATQLTVGSTLQLTRTFTPANTTDQTGAWSSNNNGVATVDSDGLVTGVGDGEVIIGYYSNRNTSIVATYNLTVGAGSGGSGTVAVTSVSLASAGDATSVDVGSTLQLTPTVSPADATDQTVSYSSSDETVATVDIAGLVTGVAAGSVTITVTTTDGSRTATKSLTVIKRASGVALSAAGNATSMYTSDDPLQLTATVSPADASNKAVTYTSSDTTVATIDANGGVTAVAPGAVTITVTTTDGSFQDTYSLTVLEHVTGVSVSHARAGPYYEGETLQMTANMEPVNASDKSVTWSVSNSSIATIDASGLVTFVGAGVGLIITATANDNPNGINAGSYNGFIVYGPYVDISSVTVTSAGGITSINTGATLQLSATVEPSIAPNKTVTWTSASNAIATVDASGVVTAVGAGTVSIRATSQANNTKYGSISITVTVAATSVSVSGSTNAMTVGGSTQALTATVSPANATNKAVTWSSSDATVASVDASGVVTAVANGSANIYATTVDGGHQSSAYAITVTTPVSGVTVTSAGGATSLNKTTTLQLTATVAPANASNKAVTWSSSNTGVATVDASGLVTGVAGGSVTITATSVADGTKAGTIALTIVVPVSGVTVTSAGGATSLNKSATLQLTATVAPADASNKAVTWSSSDAGVATVDASGLVTGVAGGSVTITATSVADGTKAGTKALTVVVPVSGVTVTSAGGATSLNTAATLQLTATVAPVDASNKAVTWSSSDAAVATVDASGLVTSLTAGSVTITATSVADGTKAGTIALTVNASTVAVTGVTVSGGSSVVAGSTLQLTATIAPSDATNKAVTWSTSSSSVATVNSSGVVTGVAAGSVTIRATSQADATKYGSQVITVTAATIAVSGVTVSGGSSVTAGSTLQLSATVAPVDASNKAVTWSTSSSAVATVDASGLVTGVAAGSVTIRATSQADATKFGSQAITVAAVPIVLSAITHDASSNVFTSAADGITDASAGIYIGDASNVSCIFLNSSVTGSNATLIWSTNRAGVSIVPVVGTNKVKAWFSTPITQNVTISVKPEADQTQVQTFVLKPMLRNTTISLGSSAMTITKGAASITTTAISPPVFDLSGILAATATRKVIEWSTDVSGIIRVDVSGADSRHVSITGLAAGTVTITGRAADKPTAVASLKITVRLIGTVTEITRQDGSANTVTIYPGASVVIYVDKSPASATILTPTWATSDKGVLGVAGLAADPANPSRIRATLTAPAAPVDSTAIITFTGQDSSKAVITKTAIFNVFIPVNIVSALTASQNPTYIGNTVQCACPAVLPTNATDKTLRWFVYDGNNVQLPALGVATNKATINESTGLLGCSGEGYVTVFAVANDVPNIAALTTTQAGKKYNRIVIQILARAPGLTVYAENSLGNTTSTVRFNTEPVQMKYILNPEPTQPYTITYKSLNTNNATVDASGVVCAQKNVTNTVIIEVVVVDSNGKMLSYTDSKGAKTNLSAKYTLNVSTAVTGISNNNTLYPSANIKNGPNCTPATGTSTTLAATVKVGATAQYKAALLSDASQGVIPLPKNKGPAGAPSIQIVSWSAGTQPAIPLISATGNSPSVIVKRLRKLTTAETAANPNGIPVVLTATTYDGGYSTTITVYVK